MERKNAATMHGNALTLIGEELTAGKKAPLFTVLDSDLKEKGLDDMPAGIKVIASVPSLDTPVCDLEIKRFNKEAASLSGGVNVMFISMDLPFAQKRFCDSFGIDRVTTFSDHRDADFGVKFGVLIKELRLLSRAVFVLDRENVVRYAEYVPEVTLQPDFDAVLEAVRGLL